MLFSIECCDGHFRVEVGRCALYVAKDDVPGAPRTWFIDPVAGNHGWSGYHLRAGLWDIYLEREPKDEPNLRDLDDIARRRS